MSIEGNFFSRAKNNLNPKNIWKKIKALPKKTWEGIKNIPTRLMEMPHMNKVYYSKVLTGFIVGLILGLTAFTSWPAVLTMFGVFIVLSTVWGLTYRNKDTGIKLRSYYTSAIFQYFMSCIAMWTLVIALVLGITFPA